MNLTLYNRIIEELAFAFVDKDKINIDIFKEIFFESKGDLHKSFMIISGDIEVLDLPDGYSKKLPLTVFTHFDLKSYNTKIKSCYILDDNIIFALNDEADKLLKVHEFFH